MSVPDGTLLRCSAVVIRGRDVLLLHRVGGAGDWVLPGGTPRAGEGMAACARREVREETGLLVDPSRVAFVVEVLGPDGGPRTVDIVFYATGVPQAARPRSQEPGLQPTFVPLDEIQNLNLRPPLAGHLRSTALHGGRLYAPYLANLWRPSTEPGP